MFVYSPRGFSGWAPAPNCSLVFGQVCDDGPSVEDVEATTHRSKSTQKENKVHSHVHSPFSHWVQAIGLCPDPTCCNTCNFVGTRFVRCSKFSGPCPWLLSGHRPWPFARCALFSLQSRMSSSAWRLHDLVTRCLHAMPPHHRAMVDGFMNACMCDCRNLCSKGISLLRRPPAQRHHVMTHRSTTLV
jgi:hypothetical protein